MAERYKRLMSFDRPMGCPDCPVVIEKGALLSDSLTSRNLLQLRLRNVQAKPLKAVVLDIGLADVTNTGLGTTQFSYLDLDVPNGGSFGEDTPVGLDDKTARGFRYFLSSVVFQDGSKWSSTSAMAEMGPANGLESLGQLKGQYIREIARLAPRVVPQVLPTELDGLWYCTCGAMNALSNASCSSCGLGHEAQKAAADMEYLAQQQSAFEERATREREAQLASGAKRRKIAAVAIPIVIVLVIGAGFVVVRQQQAARSRAELAALEARYAGALSDYDSGNYTSALKALESLPRNFRDVSGYAENAKVQQQLKSDFVTSGEGSTITHYEGAGGDVIVPKTMGGKQIAAIDDYAFSDCTTLVSVTIPEGVTRVGHEAFSGCTSLSRVTMPASLTAIGYRAFRRCTSLPSITVPKGVITVGAGAFSGCTKLVVRIPTRTHVESRSGAGWGDWVTDGAFDGCVGVEYY